MGNGEREDENRRLAEWLGIKPRIRWIASRDGGESLAMDFDNQWDCDQWCKTHAPYQTVKCPVYPDFYGDEAANAMLLEKLTKDKRFCCVELAWDGEGDVWDLKLRLASRQENSDHTPIQPLYSWPERKEAVVETILQMLNGGFAALALLNERGRG